nr:GNAT family N-acetyltransferase [Amycolatopsis aidingensis]
MDDRPGTLAKVAIRLADLECNILGVTVLPVPGGVLDEVVVRPPMGLTRSHLVEAISAEGCACAGITDADLTELVDTSTAALAAARRAVLDPEGHAEAVREVLAADVVTTLPASEANTARAESGHRAVLPVGGGRVLVARRSWAPFVQLELARARALLDLLGAERANLAAPSVLTTKAGADLVLREGGPADADAVRELHARCSPDTLFLRYHTGLRTITRRWSRRLLMPPRGLSVLARHGREVVAIGQLIAQGTERAAEVSLLVADAWQRQGVGSGLLSRLAVLAAGRGYRELVAVCLPGQDGVRRAALRAGLAAAEYAEDGSLRIGVSVVPSGTGPHHAGEAPFLAVDTAAYPGGEGIRS